MTDIVEYFKKRKYKVKYILYFTITWTEKPDNIVETITYLLLENGFSNRKIEIKSYGYCQTFEKERTTSVYLKVVLPWLENIDGQLKRFKEDCPDNVIESDDNEAIIIEEKGKVITIKRDK